MATPGTDTIEKLSSYLGVPARKIIKAVLYVVNGKDLVMFMIRGDRNVDENKVEAVLSLIGFTAITTVRLF